MKFDLHTHHERCGHAIGTIEDYIRQAIQLNLDYIGISDHTPHFYSEEDHLYPGITMKKSEFKSYVEEVLQLKEKYASRIHVLLGIESDFFIDHMIHYHKQFELYPFDYIIGSVHFIHDINIFQRGRFDSLTQSERVQVKESYYEQIALSAKSGFFQILGHIDAMKGYYPPFSDLKTEVVDKTLKIIGEEQVAIEINTSGKTKDVGGWYPANEILERALFYSVPVTFGSDAHTPERIADDFDLVRKRLKEIGYKEWTYFINKKAVNVSL
ncbi:histidinol-phosphatase [Halalkalibacter sp. APA_J-10(15)]|uniref:histidinol-phosphatase n=1 Tax=unclassified Halalkalibacter TaxID=2893063 RepID=UPI001FF28F90|nr:histidinol-phosphatase [Halalkalibacter sp. APA_J-10(15)]MCK0473072.1 histidinol-phosphatase [Halalkalibacter sp. APA_J-10(15)]